MTTSLTSIVTRCGVLAITGAVALTSCSSSGSKGTPASPAQAGTTTAAHVGSTTAAAASSATVDVCTLLPAATVAQLSGVPVTRAKQDGAAVPKGLPLTLSQCNYTGGTNQIDITYTKSSYSSQQFDSDFDTNKSVIKATTMVSGIGDKAFTDDFPSEWLEVLWDGALYEISGGSKVGVPAAEKIVTALHGKA